MADVSASSSSKALLPPLMQVDDEPTAVEPARRKANSQKTPIFPFLPHRGKQSAKKLKRVSSDVDISSVISPSSSSPTPSTKAPPTKPPPADGWPLIANVEADIPAVPEPNKQIELESLSAPLNGDSTDVYRWAVVYENQRGWVSSSRLLVLSHPA